MAQAQQQAEARQDYSELRTWEDTERLDAQLDALADAWVSAARAALQLMGAVMLPFLPRGGYRRRR